MTRPAGRWEPSQPQDPLLYAITRVGPNPETRAPFHTRESAERAAEKLGGRWTATPFHFVEHVDTTAILQAHIDQMLYGPNGRQPPRARRENI